jgi:hypothetical protein
MFNSLLNWINRDCRGIGQQSVILESWFVSIRNRSTVTRSDEKRWQTGQDQPRNWHYSTRVDAHSYGR